MFKYFLNINTIWGLMVLSAFALCVAQTYMPTKTVINDEWIKDYDDSVPLSITLVYDKENKPAYEYAVVKNGDELVITDTAQAAEGEKPWLISVEHIGEAHVLTWDSEANAQYAVAIGGKVFKTGRLANLKGFTEAAFDYAETGFTIALGLVASMVLFLGLMKVGEEAGIVQLVAKVFYPVIRFLFPDVPKDHPASGAILMNVTTTILGLGNAATPFGIKAMKELETLNPNPGIATESQVMLLGYNTAGLALLPTTLIAMRKTAGCSDPFEIIGTCMFAGAVSTLVAIIMVKVLGKIPVFSVKTAVAEQQKELAAANTSAEGEDA